MSDGTDQSERAGSSVDFDRLVETLRTQSKAAPGSDTGRVTIRTLESVSVDALAELLSALEDRTETGAENVDPAAIGVYLSPTNAERMLEAEDESDFDALEERVGRPIHVESAMPEDAILVMDPAAVTVGPDGESEIDEPNAIAIGTLGTAT